MRRSQLILAVVGIAVLAFSACRPDSTNKADAWPVATSFIPIAGVDTLGTAHVGLDIGLGEPGDPYNPCHPHSDANGQYNDSYYAACIDANANPVSYFKHWRFGAGGAEISGNRVSWGNWEPNHCPTAPWCPRQGDIVGTNWAQKATSWALEFYPHRSDEGGVRLQGGFTQRGGDWVAAPDLGVIRFPRAGAPRTVRLSGYVAGVQSGNRYQVDAWQRDDVWMTTSTGYPQQGFASVTNAGGVYGTPPLPSGGYYLVVTDNHTGDAYGVERWLGPYDRMDIHPTAPCFGLGPAFVPFTDQRRC